MQFEIKDFISIIIAIISLVAMILYNQFGFLAKVQDKVDKAKEDYTMSLNDIRDSFNKTINDMSDRYDKEILVLSSEVRDQKVKTDLYWKCIESKVVDMLKSYPTDVDKDVLLDKFLEKSLKTDEAERLRTILNCEMAKDKEKFLAYILVIARLEQIIYELRKTDDTKMVDAVRSITHG